MKKRNLIAFSLATILVVALFSGCNRAKVATSTTTNPLSPSVTSQSTTNRFSDSTSSTPTGYDTFTDTSSYMSNTSNIPQVNPNQFEKFLKVDADVLNQWQATSVVASGGKVYFTAVDAGGFFKKGTVIQVEGEKDKWTDIGGSLLAMTHSMNETLSGITFLNGSVFAIDQDEYVYKITGRTLKKFEHAGGKDIAGAGSSLYIVTKAGTIEKTDESVSSSTPIPNLIATGGIAGDSAGNLYVVSNGQIVKVDMTGMSTPVVTANLSAPIDVAVDSEGSIYVLDGALIKRFDSMGNFLVSVAVNGNKPNGISVDENKKIYVSTYGNDYKDSKILVYMAGTALNTSTNSSAQSQMSSYNTQY